MILLPPTSPKWLWMWLWFSHSWSVRTQGSPLGFVWEVSLTLQAGDLMCATDSPTHTHLGILLQAPSCSVSNSRFWDWTCTCNWGLVVSILAESERAVAVICGSWPPLVATWWAKRSLSSPLFVLQPDIGALQAHNHHYVIQKCLSSDLWVMKEGDKAKWQSSLLFKLF